MDTIESIASEKFHETMAINRQLGEMFILKMQDNPIVFTGIPVLSSSGAETFSMKVMTPKEATGIFDGKISNIEYLVKQ